jgi:hypothetical protein
MPLRTTLLAVTYALSHSIKMKNIGETEKARRAHEEKKAAVAEERRHMGAFAEKAEVKATHHRCAPPYHTNCCPLSCP